MNKKIRIPAIPLITVDPYFSIWSCGDNLYDDCTRHWSGIPNPIVVGVFINGFFYSLTGITSGYSPLQWRMHQKSVKVTPLSSEYIFENERVTVTLKFTTPLILDDLDILARPVSYIEYQVENKTERDLDIEFVFGINARCTVNEKNQKVVFKKTEYSLCVGNSVQNPLSQSGDKVGIDWGYLHLCDKSAFAACWDKEDEMRVISEDEEYNAFLDMPYLTVRKKERRGIITLAYDEIYPIEYFGQKLKESYTTKFDSFESMVICAVSQSKSVLNKCKQYDEKILADARHLGEYYQKIISIAYRQAVSAHKMVYDNEGNILFLSKECSSNGCIGTLDVTYPSMPLFLKYNPKLVLAMLRQILKFAESGDWKYEFAPHDVGQYPLANGQVYGMEYDKEKQIAMQMPVEECGNMLLCLAALKKYLNNKEINDFLKNHHEILKGWLDYLIKHGYKPGEQLCTDDFAGHLAQNCNLSLKAILAIASYSYLFDDKYSMEIAKKYAVKWEKDALASHGATRLTFNDPAGWSIKYNLVWDNILGFGLFSENMKNNETELYKRKMNKFGVPLDMRKNGTKLDWLIWSTMIYKDEEYFNAVIKCVVNMLNETSERVPLTDRYCTLTGEKIMFQARSVVGGIFINLL